MKIEILEIGPVKNGVCIICGNGETLLTHRTFGFSTKYDINLRKFVGKFFIVPKTLSKATNKLIKNRALNEFMKMEGPLDINEYLGKTIK